VIVTFEVILSVRMVINKRQLSEIIWDRICDIMSSIVSNIEYYEATNINKDRLHHLQINFHENIDCIEKLLQQDRSQILGNVERIYDLIERVADRRPEASVLALIEYRSRRVTATRPEWLQVLAQFVRRYYRMSNVSVRIKTIEALVRIMDQNRACYEEEILSRVVLVHLSHIHQEPSVQVRVAVARALSNFATHCDTKRCMDPYTDPLQTAITILFNLTNDLIVPNKPAETRQIALSFYKRLIHTQYKNLTIMREKFFLVIQNHEAREDLRHLLELLDTLTDNGKDITNFEEKVGLGLINPGPSVSQSRLALTDW